jgi:hypothetical protein
MCATLGKRLQKAQSQRGEATLSIRGSIVSLPKLKVTHRDEDDAGVQIAFSGRTASLCECMDNDYCKNCRPYINPVS